MKENPTALCESWNLKPFLTSLMTELSYPTFIKNPFHNLNRMKTFQPWIIFADNWEKTNKNPDHSSLLKTCIRKQSRLAKRVSIIVAKPTHNLHSANQHSYFDLSDISRVLYWPEVPDFQPVFVADSLSHDHTMRFWPRVYLKKSVLAYSPRWLQ